MTTASPAPRLGFTGVVRRRSRAVQIRYAVMNGISTPNEYVSLVAHCSVNVRNTGRYVNAKATATGPAASQAIRADDRRPRARSLSTTFSAADVMSAESQCPNRRVDEERRLVQILRRRSLGRDVFVDGLD